MPIWLTIDEHSGIPIYLQLVEQVQHALEVGTLQAGDALPTVRDLASELTLAPNTIVKAYSKLQALGLIKSRTGAGTVVTAGVNGSLRQAQQTALFERIDALVCDAAGLGLDPADLLARLQAAVAEVYPSAPTEGAF